MLCTKVLTIDNKLIIVPNSEAMGGKITNFSSEELRRVDIETKAGYANKFEDVYAAVLQAVKDTPTALQDPALRLLRYRIRRLSCGFPVTRITRWFIRSASGPSLRITGTATSI